MSKLSKAGHTWRIFFINCLASVVNFVEWHNMAPCLMTGGKDYMIWLVNALTGKVMTNLIGHEDEVIDAKFTKEDRGKHIVSCSADKTIRVWSPLQAQSVITLKSFGA